MRIAVYLLTALAALAILITWVRLRATRGGSGILRIHTFGGIATVAVWLTFLIAPASIWLGSSAFGIIGIGGWWVVSLAGLLLITRWLPARGRHASEPAHRGGLAPALVIHLGVLIAVGVFTWAYLSSSV